MYSVVWNQSMVVVNRIFLIITIIVDISFILVIIFIIDVFAVTQCYRLQYHRGNHTFYFSITTTVPPFVNPACTLSQDRDIFIHATLLHLLLCLPRFLLIGGSSGNLIITMRVIKYERAIYKIYQRLRFTTSASQVK